MEYSEINYIVNQFGPINENIDEYLLENILQEISTLESMDGVKELAFASIELGKPQILEYLLVKK